MSRVIATGALMISVLAVLGLLTGAEWGYRGDGGGEDGLTPEELTVALASPSAFDQGFVPDTATVAFCIDDGYRNFADSVLHYVEDVDGYEDFRFGFALITSVIDTSTGSTRLTWDMVADLEEQGHEIINHTWQHENPSYLSLEDAREDIDRGLRKMVDTLGFDVRGFSYPNGDLSMSYWSEVARLHEYGTALNYLREPMYESDPAHAVSLNSWFKWWYFHGSVIAGADTLRVTSTPDSACQLTLIYPNAVLDPWRLPALCSNGPNPGDGVRNFRTFKAWIKYLERNRAAGIISMHQWNAGTSHAAWMSKAMAYMLAEKQAGRLRIHTPGWVARNYCYRRTRSGINLFPDPHGGSSLDRAAPEDTAWSKYAKNHAEDLQHGWKPDGFMSSFAGQYGWSIAYVDTGSKWWWKTDGTGFGGGQNHVAYFPDTTIAGPSLIFMRVVPPNCWVYASFKVKGDSALRNVGGLDSMIVQSRLEAWSPRLIGSSTHSPQYGSQAATPGFATWTSTATSAVVAESDAPGGSVVYSRGSFTWALGYKVQNRVIKQGQPYWKEVKDCIYVGEANMVVWRIAFPQSAATRAKPKLEWGGVPNTHGIDFDDFMFVVVQRSPVPSGR